MSARIFGSSQFRITSAVHCFPQLPSHISGALFAPTASRDREVGEIHTELWQVLSCRSENSLGALVRVFKKF